MNSSIGIKPKLFWHTQVQSGVYCSKHPSVDDMLFLTGTIMHKSSHS